MTLNTLVSHQDHTSVWKIPQMDLYRHDRACRYNHTRPVGAFFLDFVMESRPLSKTQPELHYCML